VSRSRCARFGLLLHDRLRQAALLHELRLDRHRVESRDERDDQRRKDGDALALAQRIETPGIALPEVLHEAPFRGGI
jgi:hypothetical protein